MDSSIKMGSFRDDPTILRLHWQWNGKGGEIPSFKSKRIPGNAVLNDDISRVEVAEGREATILQKQQRLEDLAPQPLNLKQRQSLGTLPVLLAPVILPPALQFQSHSNVCTVNWDIAFRPARPELASLLLMICRQFPSPAAIHSPPPSVPSADFIRPCSVSEVNLTSPVKLLPNSFRSIWSIDSSGSHRICIPRPFGYGLIRLVLISIPHLTLIVFINSVSIAQPQLNRI